MHSNCGYVSLVFARPTFIQKTVLLDRLNVAETGDFFPDQSFGRMSEGIDAAVPSTDLRDEGFPATTKVKRSLRRSRAGYHGFLTKLYKEIEFYFLTNATSNSLTTSSKLFMQHSLITNERMPSIWTASMIRKRFRNTIRNTKVA